MNEPPLRPWVACRKTGDVVAGHCACKAGLGEVCSHVAATLFFLLSVVNQKKDKSCTSEPCEWNGPSGRKAQYREAWTIDFTSSATKKKRLDHGGESAKSPGPSALSRKLQSIPAPTEDDRKELLAALSQTGTKCAILSLSAGHAEQFVPASASANLPEVLTMLYNQEAAKMDHPSLMQHCEDVFRSLSVSS